MYSTTQSYMYMSFPARTNMLRLLHLYLALYMFSYRDFISQCILAEARQVDGLVMAARLSTRHVTASLQIQIIITIRDGIADEEIELCFQVSGKS